MGESQDKIAIITGDTGGIRSGTGRLAIFLTSGNPQYITSQTIMLDVVVQ